MWICGQAFVTGSGITWQDSQRLVTVKSSWLVVKAHEASPMKGLVKLVPLGVEVKTPTYPEMDSGGCLGQVNRALVIWKKRKTLLSPWVSAEACRLHAAQHKIVKLLKTLLSFITKFYYLDMYIFYNSGHQLGTCSTILKDNRKGRCIIRVIM